MTPAPPPPVGAPEPVLGAWAHLSGTWAKEEKARETLAALVASHASHGILKAAEEDLAFAEHETEDRKKLYRYARQEAGLDTDDARQTA